MMNDSIGVRRPEQYSPKSSPRGSRSPLVHRHDTTTGTLRTTISLGKTPAIVHSGPFYLMKEAPGESELTGAKNLMSFYNLEHAYNKFSGRKMKDQLSAFLPNLPGNVDTPGHQDNSSLRSLIDKPPIGGKELQILNGSQLAGFRLHPGPIPEQFRLMSHQPQKNKKHKHKKHKHKSGEALSNEQPQEAGGSNEGGSTGGHDKKDRKRKRHDDEKERKKKKKEKRKKKQKHTPESGSVTPNPSSNNDARKI